VQLLGGQQRKAVGQVVTDLTTEHCRRARARAVAFAGAVGEDIL